MDYLNIIREFYKPDSMACDIFLKHGELVTKKALDIAGNVSHLNPDSDFILEAAMLHDIGIFRTHAPAIGCMGNHPYVTHGILGREILEKIGFPKHALVCERHVGVGITAEDVRRYSLPLPERDMVPESMEEQIICFADKFYSKNPDSLEKEKSIEDIVALLQNYDGNKVIKFNLWVERFMSSS